MGTELARPTVLTPEAQETILKAMAAGSYLSVACDAAGVSRETLMYWQTLHDSGEENASRFAVFFSALKRATSIAEVNSINALKTGMPGWQAQAWFLERRFPKRWGRKDQIKADVTSGGKQVQQAVFIIPDNGRDAGIPTEQ